MQWALQCPQVKSVIIWTLRWSSVASIIALDEHVWIVQGNYSIVQGNYSIVQGNYSIAQGNYSIAQGNYSNR